MSIRSATTALAVPSNVTWANPPIVNEPELDALDEGLSLFLALDGE